MAQPRLGFNLRLRHFNANAKRIVTDSFKNKPFETIGLITSIVSMITSIVAIGFSITANTISKSALELAKNDTVQTAQIARLNSDIVENQKQNATLSKQLETLIAVSTDTKEINKSTYKVLASAKTQSRLLNNNLLVALRNEHIAALNDTLAKESDLFLLKSIFDEIKPNSLNAFLYLRMDLVNNKNEDILIKFKAILEKGFDNKIFQNDEVVKQHWTDYYDLVSDAVEHVFIYIHNSPDNNRKTAIERYQKALIDGYFNFINTMMPSLNEYQKKFKKRNF